MATTSTLFEKLRFSLPPLLAAAVFSFGEAPLLGVILEIAQEHRPRLDDAYEALIQKLEAFSQTSYASPQEEEKALMSVLKALEVAYASGRDPYEQALARVVEALIRPEYLVCYLAINEIIAGLPLEALTTLANRVGPILRAGTMTMGMQI